MSELLWRVQLKERRLTISSRSSGEEQSFFPTLLFAYFLGEWTAGPLSSTCCVPAFTCWISLSPTAVLGTVYKPISILQMRIRRPKRHVQNHSTKAPSHGAETQTHALDVKPRVFPHKLKP